MPSGRLTKYKKEYCEMLITHMKQGLSFESFAPTIGVNRDTLYEWEHRHQIFSDAKKVGNEHRCLFVEKIYINAAMGRNEIKINGRIEKLNPSAAMMIFLAKNTLNWRDKRDVEHSGGISISGVVKELDDGDDDIDGEPKDEC